VNQSFSLSLQIVNFAMDSDTLGGFAFAVLKNENLFEEVAAIAKS
jgi:hypothetical protein